jgi:hypothetical protein
MDQKTAAQGVRTYAKNAAVAHAGQVSKLSTKLDTNPNTVDVVQDFQAFMDTRALAVIYQETLNLDPAGSESPYDDAKVIDRIQDKRASLIKWILQHKSPQSGLHAVHQHVTVEAAKKFVSDTYFIADLDDNEEN